MDKYLGNTWKQKWNMWNLWPKSLLQFHTLKRAGMQWCCCDSKTLNCKELLLYGTFLSKTPSQLLVWNLSIAQLLTEFCHIWKFEGKRLEINIHAVHVDYPKSTRCNVRSDKRILSLECHLNKSIVIFKKSLTYFLGLVICEMPARNSSVYKSRLHSLDKSILKAKKIQIFFTP